MCDDDEAQGARGGAFVTKGELDLSGRVAIVTGAGRGLGRHFALEIARARGAVALVGRTAETLERVAAEVRAYGVESTVCVADVSDPEVPDLIIASVERELGPVSVLVNNAAVMGLGSIQVFDPTEWWGLLETNLRGPMLWTKAVATGMINRRSGHIVNLTSTVAKVAMPNGSAYCVSKAAISHFTACVALDLAPFNVKVFALAPIAATEMVRDLTVAPELSDEQRARFRYLYENVGEENLAMSLELFVEMLSGRIDALSGKHLESRVPLIDQGLQA